MDPRTTLTWFNHLMSGNLPFYIGAGIGVYGAGKHYLGKNKNTKRTDRADWEPGKALDIDVMQYLWKNEFITSNKYIFGFSPTTGLSYDTDFDTISRNVMYLGPPGTGKSSGLISALIQANMHGYGGFFIDPTADHRLCQGYLNGVDLLEQAGLYRASDVIIFDPLDPACPSIDLLAPFPGDTGLSIAQRIFQALNYDVLETSSTQYYTIMDTAFISYACVFLFEGQVGQKRLTWIDMERFAVDEHFRDHIVNKFITARRAKNMSCPEVEQFRRFEAEDGFKQAADKSVGIIRQFALFDPLRPILNSESPVIGSLLDAVNEKKTIIFLLPSANLPFQFNLLGKFLVANFQRIIDYRNRTQQAIHPHLFIVDELARFNVPEFLPSLAYNRKGKMAALLGLHYLGQLLQVQKGGDSDAARNELLTNNASRVVYTQNGLEAEFWAKQAGMMYRERQSERIKYGILMNSRDSKTVGEEEASRYHADFFKKLPMGYAYVQIRQPDGSYQQGECLTPRPAFLDIPRTEEEARN